MGLAMSLLLSGAAKDSEQLHDFKLLCDGREFPCSKFILGAHSEVFRAMFSHSDTTEASQNMAVIEDSTPEALEIFLQLLYTGQDTIPITEARYFIANLLLRLLILNHNKILFVLS